MQLFNKIYLSTGGAQWQPGKETQSSQLAMLQVLASLPTRGDLTTCGPWLHSQISHDDSLDSSAARQAGMADADITDLSLMH